MKPRLERWVQHGNCLVGYLFDHKQFDPGTRIITEPIREFDVINHEAVCLDGKYILGEPGTVEEHNQPLIGQNKKNILL